MWDSGSPTPSQRSSPSGPSLSTQLSSTDLSLLPASYQRIPDPRFLKARLWQRLRNSDHLPPLRPSPYISPRSKYSHLDVISCLELALPQLTELETLELPTLSLPLWIALPDSLTRLKCDWLSAALDAAPPKPQLQDFHCSTLEDSVTLLNAMPGLRLIYLQPKERGIPIIAKESLGALKRPLEIRYQIPGHKRDRNQWDAGNVHDIGDRLGTDDNSTVCFNTDDNSKSLRPFPGWIDRSIRIRPRRSNSF